MFCPECGTENRSNARFCKGCGLRFDDDEATETVSPYETTISIQPAEPSRTTVFATPSYNESGAQEATFKPADLNPTAPPVAPTVPVGDRTAVFGGNSAPLPGFGETSSSSGLIVGDLVPSASLPPPPGPAEMPILLIGQDDLAPPTVPNTPFPVNPHDPETVPSRPLGPIPPTTVAPAVPPPFMPPPPPPLPAGRATMPPPSVPTVPPPIQSTSVMASVPPPIPPTSVMAPVPPPASGFAGVMPLRADPSPSAPPDLPPDVAAQPFKPIAPPGGTPRPMGQARPADLSAPRPPADLFSQPAPTVAAEGKKSKTPLILGLLGGVGVLFLLLAGIGFVAYQRFAKPKPIPQPVKTTPPDSTTTPPPTTTEPPPVPASVIPPDMIAIPGGEYVIGRNEGDLLDKFESPQHPVTLQPYYIDKTEVTNADYKKFMEATGHGAPATWPNGQIKQGTEYFPVTGVSHADAEAYAKWAGKRLPTEDEWEAAAHGRTPSLFPWGNDQDFSRMNIKPSGIEAPVRVGASPAGASPFGVLDMSGNVWEWTATEAAPYPGSKETVTPEASGKRQMVIRGGAFNEVPKRCTTTFRNWVPFDFKGKELGFRCVKSQ